MTKYYKKDFNTKELLEIDVREGQEFKINCDPCDECGYMKTWDCRIQLPSGSTIPAHLDFKLSAEKLASLREIGMNPKDYCKSQKITAPLLGSGECEKYQPNLSKTKKLEPLPNILDGLESSGIPTDADIAEMLAGTGKTSDFQEKLLERLDTLIEVLRDIAYVIPKGE